MYCTKCGKEIAEAGARFCNHCGAPQNACDAQSPPIQPPYVFKYSEETINTQKKGAWGSVAVMLVMFVAMVLILSAALDMGEYLSTMLILVLVIFAIAIPIGMGVRSGMYKKMREIQLIVCWDRIVRISANSREDIYYNQVLQIKHVRDKKGKILYIRISTTEGGRIIASFENMDGILELLKIYIPNPSIFIQNKGINPSSPGVIVLTLLIVIVVCYFVISEIINSDPEEYIQKYGIIGGFLFLSMSLFLLIYSPWKRANGARLRKYDIVASILALFVSAICFLLAYISLSD